MASVPTKPGVSFPGVQGLSRRLGELSASASPLPSNTSQRACADTPGRHRGAAPTLSSLGPRMTKEPCGDFPESRWQAGHYTLSLCPLCGCSRLRMGRASHSHLGTGSFQPVQPCPGHLSRPMMLSCPLPFAESQLLLCPRQSALDRHLQNKTGWTNAALLPSSPGPFSRPQLRDGRLQGHRCGLQGLHQAGAGVWSCSAGWPGDEATLLTALQQAPEWLQTQAGLLSHKAHLPIPTSTPRLGQTGAEKSALPRNMTYGDGCEAGQAPQKPDTLLVPAPSWKSVWSPPQDLLRKCRQRVPGHNFRVTVPQGSACQRPGQWCQESVLL
ncbi:uncharacterized protein LOC134470450 [Cavia porcellus]|uniref:uncharacterized protein LOC134470450 n=1 Tax=Cavia porcellus TaxID=10141 RepID=UPI002FE3116C